MRRTALPLAFVAWITACGGADAPIVGDESLGSTSNTEEPSDAGATKPAATEPSTEPSEPTDDSPSTPTSDDSSSTPTSEPSSAPTTEPSSAPPTPSPPAATDPFTAAWDVLSSRCVACHSRRTPMMTSNEASYSTTTKQWIATVVSRNTMPPGGGLSDAEKTAILDWTDAP